MEIEAKFHIPNVETYRRLQKEIALEGYHLSPIYEKTIVDSYLDTPERSIFEQGYACRMRRVGANYWVGLKDMGQSNGAIHKREERELALPAPLPLEKWPADDIKTWVAEVVGQNRLEPIIKLQQKRLKAGIQRHGKPIAELSLDAVRLLIPKAEVYYELEVELIDPNALADLEALSRYFQREWRLPPHPTSKLERALAVLDGKPQPPPELLPPTPESQKETPPSSPPLPEDLDSDLVQLAGVEVAQLEYIAGTEKATYQRRARAILALGEGLTQEEAGLAANLSARRVRHWLHEFREKGMDVFPSKVLRRAEEETRPLQTPSSPPVESESKKSDSLTEPSELPEAVAEDVKPEPSLPATLPTVAGVAKSDTLEEGLRKLLWFQFQYFSHNLAKIGGPEHFDAVHDARVAIRRMRVALRVFEGFGGETIDKKWGKALRRTGRKLGRVRDLDVFHAKTQIYLEDQAPDMRDSLAPLLTVWQAEHDVAVKKLLKYFESKRFAKFKAGFETQLDSPLSDNQPNFNKKGDAQVKYMREAMPWLIYRQMAYFRAYTPWVAQPSVHHIPLNRLHRLRIASKRLRYTLEYFGEMLGPEVAEPIETLKGLQDHLGDLQDASVASGLLRDFLTWGKWGHKHKKKVSVPDMPIVAPGVVQYMAYRQREIEMLLRTFPSQWQNTTEGALYSQIANLVAEI